MNMICDIKVKPYLVESNGVEHEAKVHPRDRHIGNQ